MSSRLVLLALVALHACTHFSVATVADDHLVPVDPDRGAGVPDYGALLQKKLFVTPANYGRVLVLPSAASLGEYALSLYSTASKNVHNITYTKAARNLWYQRSLRGSLSLRDDPYSSQEPIRITRIDAVLPPSTALAIRAAWTEALRGTAPHSRGGPIVVDGADFEFSLVDRGKTATGVIMPGMREGKSMSQLIAVTELLETYCKAGPNQRAHIALQIEKRANDLVRCLHR
jgi:hypothetical protein